jgi:parallel beta-helix repeat protein
MFKEEQIIGRYYKIISRLGKGGMGQVYRAKDVNLGRDVAIKFLLPEIAKDEEIVKRFLNEGRIMATINHPAVISVYASDVEEESGIPFLVMEFVDGKSLDKYHERLRKDTIELIRHFIQLLSGIHACHQKQIIHRDLKPENIIINKEGQLKILDFGIARSATRQTKTGIALGTPHYMSPEQCLGKQDITAKADVYAVGIILFEILTEVLPFAIDSQVDDPALTIALMHLNQEPDFSDFKNVAMGQEFKDLISKMIAKKPEERPEVPEILCRLKEISAILQNSEAPTMTKQAIKPAKENCIGDIYQIEKELGSGGMGKVYKALDTSLNRPVAIKVLHESTSADHSLVERFIHEGKTLATVGHRNVMGIYASAIDKKSNRPFLVMEYIEGKPLKKVKEALADDRTKAVPIMLQLAEGLKACHEKGIIHRDLKPGNIIVTNSGLVKILDFGIAKSATNLTKTGMTVGTPEYMSPEQCTGSKNISTKSDIYSLGIIFWELIFGFVPFKADANTNPELSVALKHIEATLPAQAAIPDMTLVKIISLARKMLDKDPQARPDIDYVIEALEDYLDEHLPEALDQKRCTRRSSKRSSSAVSKLVEASENAASKRRSFFLPALILIVLVGGGIWYFMQAGSKTKINYEKQINESILSKDFEKAAELLNTFQNTQSGQVKGSFLKVELSKAMIAEADARAANLDYQSAIDLYARAIVLNPANPQAAIRLSKLQQDFQQVEQKKARINELKEQSELLLANLEPASGTSELNNIIEELNELGLSTHTQQLQARWQTMFIASASPHINSQPEKALQYLTELQTYFKDMQGLDELVEKAKQRSREMKDELENASRLNSVVAALTPAIENFTSSQSPEFLLKQISKIEELGEQKEADQFRQKLADKMANEAEKLIVNQPQKAIELLNEARNIAKDQQSYASSLELAKESLDSLRSSKEMKEKRDALVKEIEDAISKIVPPADTAPIVSQLARLEKFKDGAGKARTLRNRLFDKYFAAVTSELENSPQNAQTILAYCAELNPGAPGLKELEKNIQTKIDREAALKKAEEEKKRAARLDTARNAIYTGIKKDPIPQDIKKIYTEIQALSKDYPESEVPQKLFNHLKDRCTDEIESFSRNNLQKAEETINICLNLFNDDAQFQKYLKGAAAKIADQRQIEKQKEAVARQMATLDNFVKSPALNKTTEVNQAIATIKEKVSATEADKARQRAVNSLLKRFANSNSPQQAQENFALIEAIDSDYKGKYAKQFARLANDKAGELLRKAEKLTASTNIKAAVDLLDEFSQWEQADLREKALNTIKDNYSSQISSVSQQDPQKALSLLAAAQNIPGLGNNADLARLKPRLEDLMKKEQNSEQVAAMLAQAQSIISRNMIVERSDQLFQIIEFLQTQSPRDVQIINRQIIDQLLTTANTALGGKDFNGAEKLVLVARQFSPDNQEVQIMQVKILEAKKAAEKPKEYVVGPTGTYRTITEAIKSAPEDISIIVQPGSYNENIVITRNIKLIGSSASRCSINSSQGPTVIITGNASLQNLTLTNSTSRPASTIEIKSGNPEVSGCTISNSTPAPGPNFTEAIKIEDGTPFINANNIQGSKGMGITITGGNPVISKNSISGCQIYGIWFNGSSKAQLSENNIRNNSKSGVGVKNGAAPTFSANIIESNGENGFLIYSNARGRYEGNRLSNNNFSGIEVWDAQPEAIRNNIFDGNKRNGLYIRGSKAMVNLGQNQFKNTSGEEVKNSGGKINKM